jgi:hypothetical protein
VNTHEGAVQGCKLSYMKKFISLHIKWSFVTIPGLISPEERLTQMLGHRKITSVKIIL